MLPWKQLIRCGRVACHCTGNETIRNSRECVGCGSRLMSKSDWATSGCGM